MTGISCYNSRLTPICLLYTEKIAEAVFPYVFKMAFPASPFRTNICKINEILMCSEETALLIHRTIFKLENSIQNQNSLDNIYSKKKFLSEIEKLPSIPVSSNKKGQQ